MVTTRVELATYLRLGPLRMECYLSHLGVISTTLTDDLSDLRY